MNHLKNQSVLAGLMIATVLLCGCSQERDPEDEESVFDPMTKTIDRAKEVELEVGNRIDELNQRLEDAESGNGEDAERD